MPTLRRSIQDGHHYIRRGLGRLLLTKQVAREGVAWLRGQGIDMDAPFVEISSGVVDTLERLGFLHTKGEGGVAFISNALTALLERGPVARVVLPQTDAPELNFATIPASMRIAPDPSVGWALLVTVSAVPAEVLPPSLGDWTTILARMAVSVRPGDDIPGLHLWPGALGGATRVPPDAREFHVRLSGESPLELQARWCDITIRGLRHGGSVFADIENDGQCLSEGERLVLGEPYVVVRHVGAERTLPPGVRPMSLGRDGDWEAVQITLPAISTPEVRDWARSIGHPLREARWKVEQVAPAPVAMAAQGYPIVPGNRALLLALVPPNSWDQPPTVMDLYLTRDDGVREAVTGPRDHATLERDRSTGALYLALPPLPVGVYSLEGRAGWVRPLVIGVTGSRALEPLAHRGPTPLHLTIGARTVSGFQPELTIGSSGLFSTPAHAAATSDADAFDGGVITDRNELAELVQDAPVDIHVPAGTLMLCVTHSDRSPVRATGDSATVTGLLRAAIQDWSPGTVTRVEVDAGAGFGRATMVIAWPAVRLPIPAAARSPAMPRRRSSSRVLQWLASAIPAFAQADETRVTAPLQEALRRAASTATHRQRGKTSDLTSLMHHPGMPTALRPIVQRAIAGQRTKEGRA